MVLLQRSRLAAWAQRSARRSSHRGERSSAGYGCRLDGLQDELGRGLGLGHERDVRHPSSTLFPVLGIAAFLGAGYRVPLAGIMFVAETTGQPFFVVPGLIVAVTADVLVGRSSVTTYQQVDRAAVVARPASRPISDIVKPLGSTISGAALVAAIPTRHPDDHDLVVTDPNNDHHVRGVARRPTSMPSTLRSPHSQTAQSPRSSLTGP